jgi:ABC-type multidrug transport system fused ATPase/permease subunit
MLTKLLRLPIGFYNERRSGEIQSVLTNDVNVYQNAIGLIRDSVGAPVKAVTALCVILYYQWELAVLAALIVPVMASIISRNAKRMRKLQTVVQNDLASLNATTVEVLQGTRVVKAFGAEERTQHEYTDLVEKTFGSQMKATANSAYLAPLQDLIGATSMAILLYLCGLLVEHNLLAVGAIVAIGFSLDQINQGLRALGGISNTYSMVQAASDRIHREILDAPEEHERSTGAILENPSGHIRFEEVTFVYADGTKALCSDFTIQRLERSSSTM